MGCDARLRVLSERAPKVTGGQRQFVPTLALAAMAAGADALFLEVHDRPDQAKSDPATVWPLDQLAELLHRCRRVRDNARRS